MPSVIRRKKLGTLALKVSEYLRIKASVKRLYEKSDLIFAEICAEMEPGQTVKYGETRAALVDNYAEGKLKVYRAHGISRYDIEVV